MRVIYVFVADSTSVDFQRPMMKILIQRPPKKVWVCVYLGNDRHT